MKRFGEFSLAIFLLMLPISAGASLAASRPIVLAELQEESIPAQDLAAPSPAAGSSPAAASSPDTNSDSGAWVAVPAGKAAPDEHQVPVSNPMPPPSQPPPVNPADI